MTAALIEYQNAGQGQENKPCTHRRVPSDGGFALTTNVLVRHVGRSKYITLNRPKAINALTLDMVRTIAAALDDAEVDPRVITVVIDGAGDRGLCAGGDVRAIYAAAQFDDPSPLTFWREEYRLNLRIAHYPKPIVAIMDGTVLGGGVGISVHASHRIVTERSAVGMPEVAIGFVPDVGGTWLLSRVPGEVGTHMALSTARLGPADALESRLADYFVPTKAIPRLLNSLSHDEVGVALDRAALAEFGRPPKGALAAARSWIGEAYSANSVEEILDRLRVAGDPAALTTAGEIAAKSPTALKVTLRALREARDLRTLESCLEAEFRVSRTFFLEVPDFLEGVRAAVVDKDHNPRWKPSRLDAVDSTTIDRCFVARDGDLRLDAG